ncbi:MAG: KEOPS complex N(6)-L-threonylcarbamoyladenine synthase Kae1 [Candidatus Micrarchaeota archaeon]|nr:KEOPS complex N(6)-L-threonylcarbamoyladenine synthase Kae1 [Candidatus Micrarchaeota archaeon]
MDSHHKTDLCTLGIESTAHTFGIGVCRSGKILANASRTYSQKFGGMKPSDAADHHALAAEDVLCEALRHAGITMRDVGLIGYSKGPGLAPCLRIGRAVAVLCSSILNVPILPVHHSLAHIEIGRHTCGMEDPLVIYVSGGNTQLLILKKGRYSVLGETLDIGLGNAIDTLARSLGLEKAHGGEIERLARTGKYFELPYTVKGMDFAFSGLVTKCEQVSRDHSHEDIAHSFQETAFAMLCEAAERALMITHKKEILLCGGVAQNTRLQGMVAGMAEENGVRFGCPEPQYNRDNGAMIAYTAGYLYHKFGHKYPDTDCGILPRYRIEDSPA